MPATMVDGAAVDGAAVDIVTLTMNPALDITTETAVVGPTDKIRCTTARYDPGGGGINVARVAHELGASVSAVFVSGGPTGQFVTDLVRAEGVPVHPITVAGQTRQNLTVNETSTGLQYRFVLPGPELADDALTLCRNTLDVAAAGARFVVASGSLPPGVPLDWYQQIADRCRDAGTLLVLDTSGAGLAHVRSGVHVLKASIRELRDRVGRELETQTEQLAAARELVDDGVAHAVVVSCGAAGALLVTPGHSMRFPAVAVGAGSGVGAGDAMVAAITVGLTRGWSLPTAVRYGIAAGAAMLLTPGTATCARSDVERFFAAVTCESVAPGPATDAVCG